MGVLYTNNNIDYNQLKESLKNLDSNKIDFYCEYLPDEIANSVKNKKAPNVLNYGCGYLGFEIMQILEDKGIIDYNTIEEGKKKDLFYMMFAGVNFSFSNIKNIHLWDNERLEAVSFNIKSLVKTIKKDIFKFDDSLFGCGVFNDILRLNYNLKENIYKNINASDFLDLAKILKVEDYLINDFVTEMDKLYERKRKQTPGNIKFKKIDEIISLYDELCVLIRENQTKYLSNKKKIVPNRISKTTI